MTIDETTHTEQPIAIDLPAIIARIALTLAIALFLANLALSAWGLWLDVQPGNEPYVWRDKPKGITCYLWSDELVCVKG